MQPTEIDRSHRLGPKPDNPKAKPRGIIVKFIKYYVPDSIFFKAKKALKDTEIHILENFNDQEGETVGRSPGKTQQ